jgi:hypothetical protein
MSHTWRRLFWGGREMAECRVVSCRLPNNDLNWISGLYCQRVKLLFGVINQLTYISENYWIEGDFLGAFAKLRKATVSFVTSVCPSAWNNSAPTRRVLMKLDIWDFCENLSRKCKLRWNPTWITGTLHKERFTFMTIFLWILRIRNISNKSCRENQSIQFMLNNLFCENPSVYEIMSEVLMKGEGPHVTIRHIRVASWISKATSAQAHARALCTHSHARTSIRTPTRAHMHTEICNTYCFSTATMVSWMRLGVTLYVHCLSCVAFLVTWHTETADFTPWSTAFYKSCSADYLPSPLPFITP